MKKFWLFGLTLMLVVASAAEAFAQDKFVVKGVVVDNQGNPVIGANVIEKDSTNGTVTSIDGSYEFTASSKDAIVEISFIGYKTVELVASSTLLLNVVLEDDATSLDDVVIIGYGTVKKTDSTGSITTIKADQLNKGMISSPADLMRGKSAGVVVTSGSGMPGSGSTIRIRGGSSLNAVNDPMVVVDGLPVSSSGISGVGDPLSSINPNDIESFTVLKDASATAIYGSRASNGVIIITTKKGSKAGSGVPNISADFTTSISQNAKYVDVMTGDTMREVIAARYGADSDAYKALGEENTNWQKQIFRIAQSYEANLGLDGNVKFNEKNYMPYRVSGGYLSQAGVLKNSDMKRGTVALNLNPTLLDNHLTINLAAKAMFMDNSFGNGGAVGAAVRMDPTQPVVDPDGLNGRFWWNYGKGTATVDNCNTMAGQNPLALIEDKTDVSTAKRFIGNAQINYKVHGLEDLSFNLNLGLDYTKSNGHVLVAPGTEQSFHDTKQNGSGYRSNYSALNRDQTLEFYLNYQKTINKHSFGIMAGYSWQHFYGQSFNESYKLATLNPTTGGWDPIDPAEPQYLSNPRVSKGEYYLISFYGRVNYNYDDRYMLTATIRDDGTSRFKNNKWGLFPSVAFGWNIANEQFLRDSDVLSALKLRLSWGQTGQQDLNAGNYPTLATYLYNQDNSMYYFGNQLIVPITPAGYNADLKWETTTTYNAGLDFGFLRGRITGSLDFYFRKTTDLLNFTPVAAGANLSNYLNANIGDLQNTGVEFEINGLAIEKKDWRWNIGLNVAWNKNKITRLTNDDERPDYHGVDTGGIDGGVGNTIQVFQTGQPVNSFYVYQQVYDTAGNPIDGLYVDRNNDGVIDQNDKYCYKKAAPDVTLGFNTQLTWKDLTLAVSAHANFGNYVYDNVASNGELLTDLWTNSFVNNRVNSAIRTNFGTTGQYWSDYYVRNASFLKIDNITLNYNINLGKCNKLDRNYRLNVFATVQNVCTISGYKGIDPEIYSGIDNNMYPRPRTYILGLKFNF